MVKREVYLWLRTPSVIRVLFGVGGNIAVSVGPQGVLIVDDQFPEVMPKIKAATEQLPSLRTLRASSSCPAV